MQPPPYPQKILIVEDESSMLTALKDNLFAAGFEHLSFAQNGEEGLAAAARENPDLILLDIVMPKMDGMTMLDKLCDSGTCPNTKIILLTNLQAGDSIMKGVIKHEPSYYLVKTDYSIADIIQKIKITLGIESLPSL